MATRAHSITVSGSWHRFSWGSFVANLLGRGGRILVIKDLFFGIRMAGTNAQQIQSIGSFGRFESLCKDIGCLTRCVAVPEVYVILRYLLGH